ncbi:uncharacterized protein [Asterias amurensis]|uniref:uncharacterized protein isoform X1 n=2 Tax=Asterias amurensis TaxID=7602 RepID=UPI003AB53815
MPSYLANKGLLRSADESRKQQDSQRRLSYWSLQRKQRSLFSDDGTDKNLLRSRAFYAGSLADAIRIDWLDCESHATIQERRYLKGSMVQTLQALRLTHELPINTVDVFITEVLLDWKFLKPCLNQVWRESHPVLTS